jgi:hypothetical protein
MKCLSRNLSTDLLVIETYTQYVVCSISMTHYLLIVKVVPISFSCLASSAVLVPSGTFIENF